MTHHGVDLMHRICPLTDDILKEIIYGTAVTLSAYGSGTSTATFHDVPGGDYTLYF